jgi:hypothetical protein
MDDLEALVFGRRAELVNGRIINEMFATTGKGFSVDGVHTSG